MYYIILHYSILYSNAPRIPPDPVEIQDEAQDSQSEAQDGQDEGQNVQDEAQDGQDEAQDAQDESQDDQEEARDGQDRAQDSKIKNSVKLCMHLCVFWGVLEIIDGSAGPLIFVFPLPPWGG